ncbi:hypothetical protein BPO_1166 [Bergeyella porcorum]|uniref:Transposase n=1 Tax=Bergeyella porcorum TaxID=1735111 RepID=A0AAU0F4V6_9FLAO
MFNSILKFLKQVWARLKKILVAIVNFFRNIADWFRAKFLKVKKKHPNAKPISLKIEEDLQSGNYNTMDLGLERKYAVVNTFFDEDTREIIEEETEVIQSDILDAETIKAFGDKEMLVLS